MFKRLFGLSPLVLVAVICTVMVTSQGVMNAGLLTGAASLPEFQESCKTDNPYLVTSCFRGIMRSERSQGFSQSAPSIIMFNETQNDMPHYQLADFRQVGTIWGLAYDQVHKTVYAGAYQKRQLPFTKEGAGAIYKIDLVSGLITTFAKLDAGPDHHPNAAGITNSKDDRSHDFVGKSGLGDVDIDEDDQYLFVTNLWDRKIYQFDLANGQQVASFENGAAGEAWAEDARPFGLEVHHGYVYHTVVNSVEKGQNRANLGLFIYRSEFDGAGMTLVGRVPLAGPRGQIHIGPLPNKATVDWRPWKDSYPRSRTGGFIYNVYPMPMATDLEIDDEGNITVALRDRLTDLTLQQTTYTPGGASDEALGVGVGDMLYGTWNPSSDMFEFDPQKETWQDELDFIGDESALGGLAYISLDLSTPFHQMIAGALGTQPKLNSQETPREGVLYYNMDGTKIQDIYDTGWKREEVCAAEVSLKPFALAAPALVAPKSAFAHNGEIPIDPPTPTPGAVPQPIKVRGPGTIGDLELLCKTFEIPPTTVPSSPTPTDTPTQPAVPPTPTLPPTPTDTPTNTPTNPPTPTPTPTPTPGPIFLPLMLKEDCKDEYAYADVVLVLDMSTSMRRPTQSGNMSKLEAVLRATRTFVRLMHLEPDYLGKHDQIAVVGFNDTAWIEQALSNDEEAILSALDQLPARMIEGTRLDLAFARGREAVPADKRMPGNEPVIIMLTDGVPNRVPFGPGSPYPGSMRQEDTVLAEAANAKADGITVYTIGVGRTDEAAPLVERVIPWLLAACATTPDRSYIEPDAEQLGGVYRQIFRNLGCQKPLFGQTRP